MAVGTACDDRHIRVELGRGPAGEGLVTRHAIGRGRNMATRLASGTAAARVATRTVGRRRERAVVDLGAVPGAGRFVAVLAHRLTGVRGIVGLGGLAKRGVAVAAGTTSGSRHVAVETGWRPTREALMARHAIGRGRNMATRLASGTAAAGVATRTVGGRRERAVIDLGAAPCRGALVAVLATGRGGNMTPGFASGSRAVVTARAIGGHRHIGM